jgi:hypothetical protein
MKELLKTIICSRCFVICVSLVIGWISAFFWYQDNPIEETSEKVIEEQTGIKIDLTPQTPEKTESSIMEWRDFK